MGVFDIELILSWTPREYMTLFKGAQYRRIDDYEKIAKQAMANRYAQNAKRAREKAIFNAQKARRAVEKGYKGNVANIEMERMTRMTEALKGFKPEFRPKKGGKSA